MGTYWDSDDRSDSETPPPESVAEVVMLCLIAMAVVAVLIALVFFTGP